MAEHLKLINPDEPPPRRGGLAQTEMGRGMERSLTNRLRMGGPSMRMIAGVPGVGKSCALLEFKHRTPRAFMHVAVAGECSPFTLAAGLMNMLDLPGGPNSRVLAESRKRIAEEIGVDVGYGLWQLAWGSQQTLNAANYAAARAAMMSFRGEGGKLLGINPTLLIVPPALESAGLQLLNSEYGTGGVTNEWKGTARLLVTPEIA